MTKLSIEKRNSENCNSILVELLIQCSYPLPIILVFDTVYKNINTLNYLIKFINTPFIIPFYLKTIDRDNKCN